ncbi:hypothetical protein IV203_006486 [Nitzschia inconspicua]|uniref:Uncharacterized protein n=1 Tax=Nitzschia inconspicua TaxID=303405 RepID=A0A9K3K8Z7_9STRA|nr:hypothetical protein IV203_006647 [Nitzschia inconspicua]KAG7340082.1 hypothetical protein IV203_006486 [Nitzschia inconspicua]
MRDIYHDNYTNGSTSSSTPSSAQQELRRIIWTTIIPNTSLVIFLSTIKMINETIPTELIRYVDLLQCYIIPGSRIGTKLVKMSCQIVT